MSKAEMMLGAGLALWKFAPFGMKRKRRKTMNRALFLIGGLGTGAGLMFILDPQMGRTRRALARDKAGSIVHKAGDLISGQAQNVANRAKGVAAEARSVIGRGPLDDAELTERVRSQVAELLSDASSVQVTSDMGHIVLSGPILADKVQSLVDKIAQMPGVRSVQNHMTVYENARDVPPSRGDEPGMIRL